MSCLSRICPKTQPKLTAMMKNQETKGYTFKVLPLGPHSIDRGGIPWNIWWAFGKMYVKGDKYLSKLPLFSLYCAIYFLQFLNA